MGERERGEDGETDMTRQTDRQTDREIERVRKREREILREGGMKRDR